MDVVFGGGNECVAKRLDDFGESGMIGFAGVENEFGGFGGEVNLGVLDARGFL